MTRRAYGLRAWLLQRVTAVYVAGFTLYVAFHFLLAPPASYAAWHEWMAKPGTRVAWAMFVVTLLLHVWVGMRDVFMDYVHPTALRLVALTVLGLVLWAYGFWALGILLSVGVS